MLNEDFYIKNLGISSAEDIIPLFRDSLSPTNRSYDYFVDWDKVYRHVNKYNHKLDLLNNLVGVNNFEKRFKQLLSDHPEIVRVFSILIAVRDRKIPVIEDFTQEDSNIRRYNFNLDENDVLSTDQIEKYYRFMKEMDIDKLFSSIKNLRDYVLGVEVGMDTHARKNRSGKTMQNLIRSLINDIKNDIGFTLYCKEKLRILDRIHDINIPEDYRDRECDFILVKNKTFMNVEVNYYRSGGSKISEIVNAYTDRYREIHEKGGEFVWITDGGRWKIPSNRLRIMFNNMPYVFNIYFTRKGLLRKAVKAWYNYKATKDEI